MAEAIPDMCPVPANGDSRSPFRLTTPGTAYTDGEFRFIDSELAAIASRNGDGAAWVAAFERFGAAAPTKVEGQFAVAVRDGEGRVHLAVDRFSIRTLCYRVTGDSAEFHERADAFAGASAVSDAQALFNYLYFHVIPAPRTVFNGVWRLPAGHYAIVDRGRCRVARWWTPDFVESGGKSFASLRDEFRHLLRSAVARHTNSADVGCFLSGGTDSSTVAGMLTSVTGLPAHTFSIGFDADGYDEMEYARTAARHFGTDHHEYYVTPRDLVESIPEIAAAYDQPFGNSSVIPTYYCAKLARENGMTRILGGDGGDELFGGNSRYARQRVFGIYDHLPAFGRRWLIEPLLMGQFSLARAPGIRKLASYVEQARVPMPQRMQMYNLLTRLGLAEVLTPEFLARVDPDEPLRELRECYAATNASSLINRMLAYDWRYTLADNDLPKVRGAAALAGIQVGFPLLDDAIVDFSLRLEPTLKLKGLRLRWFFKEALRGFLPDQTLAKRKHGFGLPFGVWLTDNADLKTLAFHSVRALGRRGIVREAFIARLLAEHLPAHPGYYGEMVWVLMMLEQWLRRPRLVVATDEAGGTPRGPRLATTGP